MPLGAFRINTIARFQVSAAAEVIRKKIGVSAIGNAQIDTAQSKFGGASALFDGSDSLDIDPTSLSFGTGDFTIEGWFRFNTIANQTNYPIILDCRDTNTDPNRINIYFASANTLTFRSGTTVIASGTHGMSTGTWYHVAFVRNSGTTTIYINGSSIASGSDSSDYASDNFFLGNYFGGGSFGIDSHVDEFRVSKTARYTTTFTPSTTPFVNDDDTLLLLHMDGTDGSTVFTDDNGVRAPVGVSAVGNAQIDTAQSKFGAASALFDGSGDYLDLYPRDTLMKWNDNDHTIETWIRINSFTGISTGGGLDIPVLYGLKFVNAGGNYWSFGPLTNGSVRFYYFNGSAQSLTTSGVTLTTNTWYHLAFVRNGSNIKIYVDGIERASGTVNGTPQYVADHPMTLGMYANLSYNGHVDEFRVSNTARYTSNFTPATEPFVNDDNTLLLIHCNGTDGSTYFEDDNGVRSKVAVIAVNNAQIDTAQSKFGGSSAYFDGTDATALRIPLSTDWDMTVASGPRTIELWVRPDNITDSYMNIIQNRSLGATTVGWRLGMTNANGTNGELQFIGWDSSHVAQFVTYGGTLSAATWHHIAITWDGTNTYKIYLDGTLVQTSTSSTVAPSTRDLHVGDDAGGGGREWFGYMDELRVSNTVRYTAAFTPATEPFQNDDNTLLLLHMDGTDGSTVFLDDNGVTAQ